MDIPTSSIDDAIDSIIEHDKADRAKEQYVMATEKQPVSGKSPVHVLVERLGDEPGQYKTVSQVAEIVGVSDQTIRRLAKSKVNPIGPSFYTTMGKTQVALYTDDDIKELKSFLNDQHKVIPAKKAKKGKKGRG